MYYFGCYRVVGHHLYSRGGRFVDMRASGIPASIIDRIDGGFAPRKAPLQKTWYDHRGEEEPQGVASLTHLDGWTVLAFWDRSVDSRGACNSSFIDQGKYSFDEMKSKAQSIYPEIFARFSFEVQLKP